MRSTLTRTTFRRLLTNEAFIFNCPHAAPAVRPLHYLRAPSSRRRHVLQTIHPNRAQRRTLFGFSRKAPREAKETDLAPGLNVMLDLMLMDKVGARPPNTRNLVNAWKEYFLYKQRKDESVNTVHADHILRTWRHLKKLRDNGEEGLDLLELEDLMKARSVMMSIPEKTGEVEEGALKNHNDFVREVFEEVTKRKIGMTEGNEESNAKLADLRFFVEALTLTGSTKEALTHVEDFWKRERSGDRAKNEYKMGSQLWKFCLKGFAREGNEAALVEAAKKAEESGVHMSPPFQETMVTFYSEKDDMKMTKIWYGRELHSQKKPTPRTISAILKACLRNNEMEWCTSVFRTLIEGQPDKLTWDVIYQWAAGALGKGVEDVEHMIEVMKKHSSDGVATLPDIETINGLVDLAMAKNDPYLAERYLALGLKHGIFPNARTYILQLDYRIDAGDLRGAQEAYSNLQGQEVLKNEDITVINKYVRALCNAKVVDYDRIMSIASDIDERQVRLEASTVSSLCMLHLGRDEIQDVLDLLNTHTFHYTKSERALIRNAFTEYCFDRRNHIVRVWDAYTILREVFDETPVETRLKIMNEFFARGRSDMATHTFGHMRQHIRPELRPDARAYVACFEGIAAAEDMESLDMVHNMMKMDSSIEPSTQLYNALMLAYTACEEPYKALDFWTDITNSREGPNYRSLEIVFWVCEGKPFGDANARQIWDRMRRMEIEITTEVFSAYVGALAGQAFIDECKALVEGAEKDLGVVPDHLTIGTFYNAAPGFNRKDEVEEWAKMKFPELWKELEKLGRTEQLEGHFLFNFKRNTKA